MSRFIKISSQGEIDSHAPDPTGNYDTLCGMDGDDPAIEHFILSDKAPTITCKACCNIWLAAKNLKRTDFSGKAFLT